MNNEHDNLASVINKNGWRQGSCLRVANSNTYPQEIHSALGEHGLYVLISQSCDLVHPNFAAEPKVELLLMKPIANNKLDGNYTYGKNPRILHCTCVNDSSFECLAKDRFFLPREYLAMVQPDKNIVITGDTLHLLIDWIVKRYRRSAFPDAFNARTGNARNKIMALLKNHVADIHKIYISLTPYDAELKPTENYQLEIYILIRPEYNQPNYFPKIETTREKIVALLEKNSTIKIIHSETIAIDQITLAQVSRLKEWDYENLSFANQA